MYRISKSFDFSASHRLDSLPAEHPCSRHHGHNYTVTFYFEAEQLDEHGMVVDYRKLDRIKRFIDDELDHRHLNDVLRLATTSELIASFLYFRFIRDYPMLQSVSVSETDATWAEFFE